MRWSASLSSHRFDGGRAHGLFPRERAAQLRDLAVELIAGIGGELREQLRALAPLPRRGKRLGEGLGQRERTRMIAVSLAQQVDRGVELTLADQAERSAQPRALALGIDGHLEIDVDRELGRLRCDVRGS